MLTYFQAIIIGALQGLTELFPVSSLGHSIILPALFGWHLDENAEFFLIFLIATHLATSLVLLGFFWKDWVRVVKGIVLSVIRRRIDPADTYAKLGWLLVIGTIPAGILGLLFQDQFKSLFSSPVVVSLFLGLNGILLLCAELLRRKKAAGEDAQADEQIAAMGFSKAVKIGFAQALALFPGFSRTGSTLGGGLLVGLDHESSARFAFLLATPIILAAAVLKLPELIHNGGSYPIAPVVIGALISAIAAYLSVRFLTKYFKTKTLMPFAIYCLATGVLSALILLVR